MRDSTSESTYTIRLEQGPNLKSRKLILGLRSSKGERVSTANPVDQRSLQTIDWILELDEQYKESIRKGNVLEIGVPLRQECLSGRVSRQTVSEYWKLRLDIGELVYPVLEGAPNLTHLYPYQLDGVRWLLDRPSGILADDMGLGKTVQVISAIRILFHQAKLRTVLVVCPKGLIANWEHEFDHWAPELGIAVVTPPAQIREGAWRAICRRRHVLLTNYEQLREPPEVLLGQPPDLIVTDEAHRLRNRTARVTCSSFALRPNRFWALTGTPLERDLDDFATLLSMVAPTSFSPNDSKLHTTSLRSRARPYILRRRKQDVLPQLPSVIDCEEELDLTNAQRERYQATIMEYRGTKKQGDQLALLTRLLSLCDIDVESRQSSKIDRIVDLLINIRKNGEKAVIFSYRLDALRELEERITRLWGHDSCAVLMGDMDNTARNGSVAQFRNNSRNVALLASSRVGGEGLTLIEANHVLFVNEWWNPSANLQARDRVVRIGQERRVWVYRFCCRDTIEESLKQVLKSKQMLFDDTVERLARNANSAWIRLLNEVGMEHLTQAVVKT